MVSAANVTVNLVKFTVELDAERALALAQFLKRAHFGTCERLSDPTKKDEPQLMMDALIAVQRSLAKAGYAPR
jgi:hypothetical protein